LRKRTRSNKELEQDDDFKDKVILLYCHCAAEIDQHHHCVTLMLTAEGKTSDSRTSNPAPAAHSRRLLRRICKSGLLVCALCALALALGFAVFVWHVPAREVALSGEADGIVALTGGASRITDAIELLAAGRGKRLLISGANPSTKSQEISRLNPEFEKVRDRVDFDRSVNTLGNAVEIRKWVEWQGFRSLIVVTSNYHIPRALMEIRHQLPGITLVPFPVVADRQHAGAFWSTTLTVRLMMSEYIKLIFARLRMALNPGAQAREAT
jgi:uncharacterized SAM-binding protein YcdF (DUF218 family)